MNNQLGSNNTQKDVLKSCINSLNISSLQIGHRLPGNTLIQYACSLTGRDFRVIAQMAPFVLYDLVPAESFAAWVSLSNLVPLIWQPEIEDIDDYTVSKIYFNSISRINKVILLGMSRIGNPGVPLPYDNLDTTLV